MGEARCPIDTCWLSEEPDNGGCSSKEVIRAKSREEQGSQDSLWIGGSLQRKWRHQCSRMGPHFVGPEIRIFGERGLKKYKMMNIKLQEAGPWKGS